MGINKGSKVKENWWEILPLSNFTKVSQQGVSVFWLKVKKQFFLCFPASAIYILVASSTCIYHLWYLHPSIIVFALLDDGIHDEEKTEIANELHQILTEEPEKQDFSYERSKKLALEVLAEEKRPSLSKFVGAASRTVFNILKLNKEQKEFLLLPPSTWHLLTAFKKLQGFACSLPITNDAAERNVKMIQDFINSSHDESLRQNLLLSVETKRKSDAVTKASKKKKI